MQAKEWTGAQSPVGWLMSEKFDGWAVGWENGQLTTIEGMTLNAPAWFTEGLPDMPLRCEIWGGYGTFEGLGKRLCSDDWRGLSLKVLDLPSCSDFFGVSHRAIEASSFGFTAHPVKQVPCLSQAHLDAFLGEIMARGGEGVVLRHPMSVYEGGRSAGMMKVKPAHDAEGTVIGHKEGKESLLLRLKNGVEFYIRGKFAPIGTEVTFRHMGFFESGKPREPRFLRIRPQLA